MLRTLKIAKNLVAIYPTSAETLVATAERKGRKWVISSIETRGGESSENWLEPFLKTIANIANPQKTSLMLILPRSEYFFTKGVYPKHLEENIEQVLTYNQSEHVFFKNGSAVLPGDVVAGRESLMATLYWAKKSLWENLSQEIKRFENFLIIPDAMVLARGLASIANHTSPYNGSFWGLFSIDENIHAIHITKEGGVTESVVANPQKSLLWEMLKKKLQSSRIIFCSNPLQQEQLRTVGIETLDATSLTETSENESQQTYADEKVPHKPVVFCVPLEEVIRQGLTKTLDASLVRGFDYSLRVNLPRVPRWCYGLMVIFLCYALFAGYMVFEKNHLTTKLSRIKKERAALEEQWKPIEQQIKVVEQMEQDKKTLESLTQRVIPIREFMEVLSTKTPKDTWINNLILTQGNKVILRGDSKSAVQYMGELAKIPGFTNVRFVSPVRKDSGSDKEFFNIEFVVDWEAFKKAQGQ